MDFDFSEDQIALRDTARDLLDDLASPARVRACTESGAHFDAALWAAIVDQGWLLVDTPEARGGLGMGVVEVAILLETLGAHAAPVPYLSSMLAAAAYARHAPGGPGASPDAAEIACVAWSRRPDAVRAVERDGEWFVSGRPDPTPDAPFARAAIVVALTEAGSALFSVDLGGHTAVPPREPAMDVTRSLGWLRFADAPATYLGGADAVDALIDRGAAYVAALMLGGARTVLDLSVAYAKDRVQFGKPIGSFQAVKHRCADMLVDVEGMHSSTYWAAWSIGADDPEASIAASTAKTWGSDASKRVMASALQVHGGIGFTWEHDLHFFLKRAQLDQLTFGDAAHHRRRLADLLRAKVDAGLSVV